MAERTTTNVQERTKKTEEVGMSSHSCWEYIYYISPTFSRQNETIPCYPKYIFMCTYRTRFFNHLVSARGPFVSRYTQIILIVNVV